MNNSNNSDSRLDEAIRAIRQFPIPDTPAFDVPPSRLNVTQAAVRRLIRYRVIGIGSALAATLLFAIITFWIHWRTQQELTPIAGDKPTGEIAKPNGLVYRSEIRIQASPQRKQDSLTAEIAHLRALLIALQTDFQRPRPYAGYDRLQRMLVTFRSSERKEP